MPTESPLVRYRRKLDSLLASGEIDLDEHVRLLRKAAAAEARDNAARKANVQRAGHSATADTKRVSYSAATSAKRDGEFAIDRVFNELELSGRATYLDHVEALRRTDRRRSLGTAMKMAAKKYPKLHVEWLRQQRKKQVDRRGKA